MHIIDIITLLILHFIADFVCQSDKMAKGKSSSNIILGTHVSVYSLFFLVYGFAFALVNGILHFITDWCSSRMTSRLWKQQRVHAFFVVIGFDQMVHMISLYVTFVLMDVTSLSSMLIP